MELLPVHNKKRSPEQGMESPRRPGQLDGKERGRLRYVLAAVGALGVSAAGAKTVYDNPEHFASFGHSVVQPKERPKANRQELKAAIERAAPERSLSSEGSADKLPVNEEYEAKVAGWQAWWQLNYNEIVFIDERGAPVGEPVPFSKFAIDKDGDSANGKEYLLTPGPVDKDGFLAKGIAGEWIDYMRSLHAEKYGLDESELRQINVAATFRAALNNTDEPTLQAGIREGSIKTPLDIVEYFAFNPDKTVKDDLDKRGRAQYLYEEINFSPSVPSTVQQLLRSYIVALAGKESKFDGGLAKNSATAEGILQLVDAVREEHGFSPDERLSFKEEIVVAGKHFSNIYTRLEHWLKHELVSDGDSYKETDRPETFATLRSLYEKDEAGEKRWQEEMIVPCMINAYNAGTYRVAAGLHEFIRATPAERLQELARERLGLFTAFSKFARESNSNKFTAKYGPDAEAYFFSIAAAKEGLDQFLASDRYRLAKSE